jgi:hypothetical protein
MSAAATDLQRAVFIALSGDIGLAAMIGGNKIFDYAPPQAGFPYITFGRTSVFDWSTGTDSGSEHILTLHVWSQAKGRKEVLEVMERIGTVLQDLSLVLSDHHLVLLRLEQTEVRFEADLSAHHGTLRFRALVE